MRNRLKHAICIVQDIIVPEAENPKSFRFDETSSSFVIRHGGCVLAAVELDDEFGRMAREIGEIGTERDLLAPVNFGEGRSETAPQNTFGFGHFSPKCAGVIDCV
jgi:hypothetical protein